MKAIVVYSSINGFTERYAKWISESLSADCIPVESAGADKLAGYDVVIFGSHIRFGDITHRKEFASMSRNLRKVVVFVVGGSPAVPGNPMVAAIFKKINRSIPLNAAAPSFYFTGGMNIGKLPESEKTSLKRFLKIMGFISKLPFPPAQKIKLIVKMMSSDYDKSSKDAIVPLVDYVNNL